jgi:hypothetical protein
MEIRNYPRWIYRIYNDKMRKEAMDNYNSMTHDMFGHSFDYRFRW